MQRSFICDIICLEVTVYGYRDTPQEVADQVRAAIHQQAHEMWDPVPFIEVRTDDD